MLKGICNGNRVFARKTSEASKEQSRKEKDDGIEKIEKET